MHDFQPLVTRRMWALKQFPAFAGIDLHELALLAENVIDASYAPGDLVAPRGRADVVVFVVAGEIECGGTHYGPREAFGMLEVLARREHGAPATATRATRTLRLDAADLGDVLEESYGVLRGTLHELAARVAWLAPAAAPPIVIPAYDPLGLVDRLVVLRQIAAFASASVDALAALAHASDELVLAPGSSITRAGAPATIAHVILDGSVHATGADRAPAVLGAGTVLGGVEMLGDLPHTRAHEAITRVRTLACSTTALFDVIEDHTDLGLAVLGQLASVLL